DEQGSWVSMTVDPKGRLIVGDQYGDLYRVVVPPIGKSEGTEVQPLSSNVGGAHGLLYAFDSLYVMVNEKPEKGLWRLRDTNGDDQFDKADHLRKFDGSGEHGPHALVLSPDKKSIYFANGNHTKPPEPLEKSRSASWDEDHLLPRMWDANGHAKGVMAPGGVIYKTDPEGKEVELISLGYRNQYDFDFDVNGEIFTFDSDMEWDMGTPWYRPTRIAHATSGSDLGWRSGSGKWPVYYPDSLPPVLDIGPGSPTGTVFGTGAKFPAKYQRAFFAADWTYGTMYAIHLTPQGASFRAEKEEFVAGKPLPLTDMIIHPQDGAMYFAIGGRKTQSALYRVTYTGTESTIPAPPVHSTPEAQLRRPLESLHNAEAGPKAVEAAWPHLAHPDRFVRFAARVAVEHRPATEWSARAFAEKNPVAAVEAFTALARVGDKALQPQLIEALGRFDLATVEPETRLGLLRAWQLAFIRMGKPSPEVASQIVAKLDAIYPNKDARANRELASLLVYLDSPTVVAKTIAEMNTARDDEAEVAIGNLLSRHDGYARAVQAVQSSRPNRQQIAYAFALRNATTGWTPELRKAFFAWFPRTHQWKGGNSFTKFIDNIRTEALANVVTDGAERVALDEASKKEPVSIVANLVVPKGPGAAYTVDDVVALAKGGLKGRNYEQGKAMFASTLCLACHHFNGEGGNVGPDLTGSGSRYTLRDLMENILEPSKVISDQYGSEQIQKKDGSLVIGRVVVEENEKLFVMTNPLSPDDQMAVDASDVKSRKEYPVSMMPPGLINPLNKEELLDLLAYIQSAGNPKDPAFAK
ncbi:MAG: c-type cytochrome, partial [Chthoniobacteraceae bacterium]